MKKFGLIMLIIGLALVPCRAEAQTVYSLQTEIDEVRRDLEMMQRRSYNEDASLTMAPTSAKEIVVQMGQMNENFRDVQGRMEELDYKIKKLNERIDLINKDIDVRFNALEGKEMSGTAASSSISRPTLPTPVASEAPKSITGDAVATGDLDPVESLPEVKEIYQKGLDALKVQNYKMAEESFSKILADYPKDSLAGNAQYWQGEVYYAQKEYEKAAVAFGKGYRNYKDSSKGADSLLKLGMSMKGLKKNPEACAAFQSLKTEFPKAPQNIKDKAVTEAKTLKCS